MLEHLDVVVGEAYAPAPDGGEHQQYGVDVVEAAHQQHRAQQRDYYDDASHRGGALLLHLALETEVAYGFAYLVALEPGNDLPAGEEGYQHADHGRQQGPERQVVHEPHAGDVHSQVLEPVYEMIQH